MCHENFSSLFCHQSNLSWENGCSVDHNGKIGKSVLMKLHKRNSVIQPRRLLFSLTHFVHNWQDVRIRTCDRSAMAAGVAGHLARPHPLVELNIVYFPFEGSYYKCPAHVDTFITEHSLRSCSTFYSTVSLFIVQLFFGTVK